MAAKMMQMVNSDPKAAAAAAKIDLDQSKLETIIAVDDEPIHNYMASVDFGSCNLQGVLDRIFRAEDSEEQEAKSAAIGAAVGTDSVRHDSKRGHLRSSSGFVFNLNDLAPDIKNDADDADMNALFEILANSGGDDYDIVDGDAVAAAAARAIRRSSNDHHHHHDSGGSASGASFSDEEQETEEQLSERIFPLKLHKMLENAERDGIQHIVSWVNNGTGFKVHNSKLFTEQVMPMFFDQTKYESFRRQLNLYCFARISRGPQRGVYSHPSFVSGRRELLSNVTRKISGEAKAPPPQPPPPLHVRPNHVPSEARYTGTTSSYYASL
jgi:hypothetical protein